MKLLIIDATNIFLRCYSVVPTMDRNGNANGGVYGFLNSLGYYIRITGPDRVVLCWDGQGGSKRRRGIVEEYKVGRKPTKLNRNFNFHEGSEEKNKVYQRLRLAEYLNDLPVIQIVVDEIEADDIIATLHKHYESDLKIIASSDKDFYQLLNEKTVIYNPGKKCFVNNRNVFERFGIHSRNFVLVRAIAGDDSDNLKGVRGIGMKNVLKYFPFLAGEEKVQIEQIFSYAESQGEKYVKFLENREVIINNLKVMRLDTSFISFSSTQKILQTMDESLSLNATSFRVKLLDDAIDTLSDMYLTSFKSLEARGKK